MSSSRALACRFALRLAAPRRLAAALAPAAPSEDTPRLPPETFNSVHAPQGSCAALAQPLPNFRAPKRADAAEPRSPRPEGCDTCISDATPRLRRVSAPRYYRTRCGKRRVQLRNPLGRRVRVSSEGAAGASAAARRRGAREPQGEAAGESSRRGYPRPTDGREGQ
jgi:hypothetical protein